MTQTDSNNKRIIAFDIIRIVAISLVIWIHCQEQINFSGILSNFTYLLGRTGVPLFLMLTGALFLLKNEINIKNIFFKKVFYFYIIAIFWFYFYGTSHLSVMQNLHDSFFLIPTAKHLWYLAMLPFLYFVLPFFYGVKKISTKNLLFFVFGCFCYKWLRIFVNFGYDISDYFVFIAYAIFGYIAYNRELYKKISMPMLINSILVTIFAFLLIYQQKFYYNLFKHYDIWWYYSPFIVVFSLQIYVLLLKLCSCMHDTIQFRDLSENCFGVYIIHYYVLLKFDYFVYNPFLLFVLTFFVSFVLVNWLSKIKIMKFLLWKK